MDSVGVEWEDPPPDKNPRGTTEAIAKQLRSRPNEWARVFGPTTAGKVESLRVMLTQGVTPGIGRGEFEARRKTLDRDDPRSVCLWARYVGNGSEADD